MINGAICVDYPIDQIYDHFSTLSDDQLRFNYLSERLFIYHEIFPDREKYLYVVELMRPFIQYLIPVIASQKKLKEPLSYFSLEEDGKYRSKSNMVTLAKAFFFINGLSSKADIITKVMKMDLFQLSKQNYHTLMICLNASKYGKNMVQYKLFQELAWIIYRNEIFQREGQLEG